MEELIKTRLIVVLLILLVIFALFSFTSCNNLMHLRKSYNEERLLRFECEEKSANFSKDKQTYEETIKKLNEEIDKQKEEIDKLKKSLAHQELLNNSLKDEINKLNKLKETLEEDLKEALSKSKK